MSRHDVDLSREPGFTPESRRAGVLSAKVGPIPVWLLVVAAVVLILIIILPAALIPRPVPCDDIVYERPGSFFPVAVCYRLSGATPNNVSVVKLGSGQLNISAFGGPMSVYYSFSASATSASQVEQPGFKVSVAMDTVNAAVCRELGVYRNPSWNCNATSWNLPYPSSYFAGGTLPYQSVPWFVRNPSNCDNDKYSANGTLAAFDNVILNFQLLRVWPTIACTLVPTPVVVSSNNAFLSVTTGQQLQPYLVASGIILNSTTLTSCSNYVISTQNVSFSLCAAASGTLPAYAGTGTVAVGAVNGFPCSAAAATTVPVSVISPRPFVQALVPPNGCTNTAGRRTNVTGSDFLVLYDGVQHYYPTVYFGPVASPQVFNAFGCSQVDVTGNAFNCSGLEVEIPLSRVVGTVAITVVSPSPCDSVSGIRASAFTYIVSDVFVVYASPPILPSVLAFDVTVYTSGLTQPTTGVWLLSGLDNTRIMPLNFTVGANVNKFLVHIPSGLAAVTYGMEVAGQLCNGFLSNATTITSVTQPDILSIAPNVVWKYRDTGVRMTFSGGLVNPSTVFISSQSTGSSTSLLAIQYESATSLTAVIPASSANLQAGVYDVVVLNPPPGNQVFKLIGGLRVQENDPIVVRSMTPEYFLGSGGTATVYGSNFDPLVTAARSCIQQSGSSFVPISPPVAPASLTVTFIDNSTLSVVVSQPTSIVPSYFFCNLILTNPDGSSATLSGFTYGTSGTSSNPTAWVESASTFNIARFGHALAGSKLSSSSRILYALGGVNASQNVISSVEYATASEVGSLSTWTLDRQPLPVGLQYSCAAALDQFVYVLGGAPGSGTSRTEVLRAQILSALAVPSFVSVDFGVNVNANQTFASGFFSYQVSAAFDGNYVRNPNGETLPSQSASFNVPNLDFAIRITLSWSAVPGAASYRIYRSPFAGANPSSLYLLAVVPGNVVQYSDNGTVPVNFAFTPKIPGELGNWHLTQSMVTSRFREGCVIAPAPNNAGTGSQYFIYAAGGISSASSAVNTIEFASISIIAPTTLTDSTDQVVGSFSVAATTMSSARFNIGMIAGTRAEFSTVPANAVRFWIGGGSTNPAAPDSSQSNDRDTSSDTFLISSSGVPQAATVAGASFPWGYCIAKGGDRFRISGGGSNQGGACSSTTSAAVAADGTYSANNDPSAGLVRCRRYSSCQRVGAFVFNCAGFNGVTPSQVWNTCELNFF